MQNYSKDDDEDKSAEGIKWTLITLISGSVAAMSPNPLIKLVASLIAVASGTNAVNCYKSSARIAYQQLHVSKEQYRLPSA